MVLTEETKRIFVGVAFVVLAVIFLLSGLRFLKDPFPILGYEVDVAVAFILIVLGMSVLSAEIQKKN